MASPAGRAPLWTLTVFAAVLLLEFFLFDHFGSRRITAIYPRWNDQIQYLSECYTGYEYARAHGLASGLWQTLVNPSAQGTLHDFAAVVLFQFVGPSRSAALALNLLALVAWQVALWIAVRRRAQSLPLAFAAAMLPLALLGPWENVPGSAYDFRLDHLAMCGIGVTSCMAVLARGLQSRAGSILFGIATGLTLLTRFITGTYFVVIFVALAIWALSRKDRAARLANLLIAALIAAAMAGPIFWLNREWVWNYYYMGHYVGPESAIRNQNFGLWRSTQFVWGWLGERHLGWFFALFATAVSSAYVVLALLGLSQRRASTRPSTSEPRMDRTGDIAAIGLIFLLAPALVLTLHPQKSEVVLGALAPGVILVIAASWMTLFRCANLAKRGIRVSAAAIAFAAVAAALLYFAERQLRPLESPARMVDLRQINTFADYVFERSVAAGLTTPRVAVDNVTDALDAQVLRVICYERHHVWKNFDMKLPTGIAEPATELVKQRAAESDFVFLAADDAPPGPFPYDRKLAILRPELRAWCEAHLVATKRFIFSGHPVVLYLRPEVAAGK